MGGVSSFETIQGQNSKSKNGLSSPSFSEVVGSFPLRREKKQLKRTKHVCVKQFSPTCDLLSLKIHLQSLREMASLKLPEVVPSPTQDSERLRKAFQGFSLSLSLQIQGTCINAEESYKTDYFFL